MVGHPFAVVHLAPHTLARRRLLPVSARRRARGRPVAADVGGYLRAFVYYSNASGTWTRAATGFTGAVAN